MFESFLSLPAFIHCAFAGVLGVLLGSFLNVVIYRYPLRLKHAWTAQSHLWLHNKEYTEAPPPGLIKPASHCSKCKTPIKAWQNIPLISFALLGGKCKHCKTTIAWRYLFVELLTGLASIIVIAHFGLNINGLAALILTWGLIALSFIDIDHQLLPDEIVLPILWFGLILNSASIFTTPSSAIIGSTLGYLSLWSVYWLFKVVTGKEGMGHGDFKLLALFGAWLGWKILPQVILISTVLGSIIGLTLIASKRQSSDQTIPFGPYIALAGWLALLYGDQINQAYLRFAGL